MRTVDEFLSSNCALSAFMVKIMRSYAGVENVRCTVQVSNSKRFAFFCYYYKVNRPSCSLQVKQNENIDFEPLKIGLRPLPVKLQFKLGSLGRN